MRRNLLLIIFVCYNSYGFFAVNNMVHQPRPSFTQALINIYTKLLLPS